MISIIMGLLPQTIKFGPWVLVVILFCVLAWKQDTINDYAALDAATDRAIEQQERLTRHLEKLTDERNEAIARAGELAEKLRKHNLADLARSKPRLIERRANDATQLMLDRLECVTDPETECPSSSSD